jgi:glucoamylase
MASPHITDAPMSHYPITLSGEPRLYVLDASAVAEADVPHTGVLGKLAALAESEGAQVAIRGVSDGLRQRLEQYEKARQFRPQLLPAGQARPLGDLVAQARVSPGESLFFLTEPGGGPPQGSYAFYVGAGTPPAGAVASRVRGPAGTDALLALYGTAVIQEKAGLAFRAASQGEGVSSSAPFDSGLFQGLIKSYGQEAAQDIPAELVQPAPVLDGELLRALAGECFARVLRNVQPNGAIVASPAKGEQPGQPNYWFVWQRDAGHVLLSMIDWSRRAPFGLAREPMEAAINSYLGFIARSQQQGNLGVSRYTVDGQPITGYGNPQLDGPAIGVLAMASLLDPRPVYPQIRAYLEYLLTPEGQGPCYDPWEFVYGRIFNVLLLKRKAFRAGVRLASLLTEDDDARRYREEVARLEAELGAFIDQQRGYLLSSRDPANPWFAEISGLDVASLDALVTAWDTNDDFLNLTDPAVMGTALALDAAFAPLYKVNRAWRAAGNAGVGWGRFPEDANDGVGSTGGNPWPLAPLCAAKYCYYLQQKLTTAGPFVVTDQRQAIYVNQVVGREIARVGSPLVKEQVLTDLLPALRRRGDGYLQFVLAHQLPDGSVTEQINRDTGQPQGARDLTWAMAELLNTLALRG